MSETRELMSRMWAPIRVMVLVAALGGGWVLPNCARAEDELQKARSEAARVWLDREAPISTTRGEQHMATSPAVFATRFEQRA